jgi:CubicO group peptidase (beta-lactamase class C family)
MDGERGMTKLFSFAIVFVATISTDVAFGAAPDSIEARTKAIIQPYVDDHLFSGTVLIAKDGRPVFVQGFGAANLEHGVPDDRETKFRIGSVTKEFTATAILQLAEAGELMIDDPVSKYYSDAPKTWEKITIRHLLTHTSGIPSYTDIPDFFVKEARIARTPEEIIKLTRDKPLQFEPGSKYAYDNSGYVLLGYIIERVSGESYADYLQKHIFDPLGMKNSGYDSSDKIIPHRAEGYQSNKGEFVNAPFIDMSLPYAAGSLYSTVDDLLIWDQALYAGKPLSPASMQQMFTDYGNKIGFGWVIDDKYGHRHIWANGAINGFRSILSRYPDDKLTAIVLANVLPAPVEKMESDLAGLYLGGAMGPAEVTLSPDMLQRYVGAYELTPTFILKVTREDNRLFAQVTNEQRFQIYATTEKEFFYKTIDVRLTFTTDNKGAVSALVLHQNGSDQQAARISEAQAAQLVQALADKVKSQTATPGSEAALRRIIDEDARGSPDYDKLSPGFGTVTRQQLPTLVANLTRLGAVKEVVFKGVGPGGADIYEVQFTNGNTEWRIALGPDGKVVGVGYRPIP